MALPMLSSAKAGEVDEAVAGEGSVVAEAGGVVDRALRDKREERNSLAGLWVLRSGLREWGLLHWVGNEVFIALQAFHRAY
jgi:hypothetical protein